jgi:S-adenosylmethionine:tRNA ribosyltransferase-isomerase
MQDKTDTIKQIKTRDYDYALPDEKIAKYPLSERDKSKLLVYKNGEISENVFSKIADYLPENSLIVFNNTRVIRARLLFEKDTGARIEIFCLEPVEPADYETNFQSRSKCKWKCFIGNRKRWKAGVLTKEVKINNDKICLTTEILKCAGQLNTVYFEWNNSGYTFAEILEAAGVLPIPPYLHRNTEPSDLQTYQTVYSKIKGSVAAPTAGLHFTSKILEELRTKKFKLEELTLHVGAGTFKPVQTEAIGGHDMHTEFISVHRSTILSLLENPGRITAVGTTAVRALESLYYIGAMLAFHPDATPDTLAVKQWTPYENSASPDIPVQEALRKIIDWLDNNRLDKLIASTQIIIVPGYVFRLVNNMITNFHQPRSTLLLLVSAFTGGGDWKKIYNYALCHNFRFLSYGDTSLLMR